MQNRFMYRFMASVSVGSATARHEVLAVAPAHEFSMEHLKGGKAFEQCGRGRLAERGAT